MVTTTASAAMSIGGYMYTIQKGRPGSACRLSKIHLTASNVSQIHCHNARVGLTFLVARWTTRRKIVEIEALSSVFIDQTKSSTMDLPIIC